MSHIIAATGIDPKTCASLLGISQKIFGQWIAGQRPVPPSMAKRISSVLGIPESEILTPSKRQAKDADLIPAIWFRLRGEKLVDADRECVFLIRLLGHFIVQLEEVTRRRALGWEPLFEDIRRKTDIQAPPREQGREAARMFRESRGLDAGQTGIGNVLRENLRTMGVLVVESPLPESKIEGCAFYVGPKQSPRPCLFANVHHTTWFRRNGVLMHELAHAIFDARTSGASLDFVESTNPDEILEQRAEGFSQEALVPFEVIRHLGQSRGIDWANISPMELAWLVAETQAEQKLVVRAALDSELVDEEQARRLADLEIMDALRRLTDRALTTEEYLEKVGAENANQWLGKRSTTIPSRSLRLPVHYVKAVVEAQRLGLINVGRASELLMIGEDTYHERFGRTISDLEG